MAPEYAMHGQFSVKTDVFSFGVLVIEIITGKRNNNGRRSDDDDAEDLLSWVSTQKSLRENKFNFKIFTEKNHFSDFDRKKLCFEGFNKKKISLLWIRWKKLKKFKFYLN